MDAKHRTLQLLGIAALSSGCLLGLLVLRRLFLWRTADPWAAINVVFVIGFVAYLISLGVRAIRWAEGHGAARNGQIKWGRVYLGALLIFSQIENYFHPAPNLLKPSNEAQAAGMTTVAVASTLLGAWLVVSGVMSRFKRRILDSENSKIVP